MKVLVVGYGDFIDAPEIKKPAGMVDLCSRATAAFVSLGGAAMDAGRSADIAFEQSRETRRLCQDMDIK